MTLIPEQQNFEIWRGGTFRVLLTLYTDEAGADPRDLTGYTAELIIRQKRDGAALHEMTTENDGIILGGEDGTIELYISDEDTADFTWRVGVYDLTVTGPTGDTDPLLYGQFTTNGV